MTGVKTHTETAKTLDTRACAVLRTAPGDPGSYALRDAAEMAKSASDAWAIVADLYGGENIDADLRVDGHAIAVARKIDLLDKASVAMGTAFARSGQYTDAARAAELALWAAQASEDEGGRQDELYLAAFRLSRKAGFLACKAVLDE